MNEQSQIDFNRIADAIEYLKNNFAKQPLLEEVAAHVNLSSFHFQKMFTEWAGVSPKKFLQYITVTHAKTILKEEQATLFDAAIQTGLSSTSRLHDLFVHIEAMTPGEFKNGGEGLLLEYSFGYTYFGKIIIASTQKGICHIAFVEDENVSTNFLKKSFSKSTLLPQANEQHQKVIDFFSNKLNQKQKINLHLKGTDFQLKVWETLLTIPSGKLVTYGAIATAIENPKASRAVGAAIGDNPIAYLIPCHRVIQSTGIFGGYMWGAKRKTTIIGWEAVREEVKG